MRLVNGLVFVYTLSCMELLDERLPQRFWDKVRLNPFNGCWRWNASLTSGGYGQFTFNGRHYVAHRLAYEAAHGLIDDGVVLDHRCCARECVNPAHLEPVTHGENSRRGLTGKRTNVDKTHCPQGHPYDGDNLILERRPAADGGVRVTRRCRECGRRKSAMRGYRLRRAAGMREGQRGPLPGAKTHCINGHEFTAANTMVYGGRRSCRECRRIHTNEAYYRRKDGVSKPPRSHCTNGHPYDEANTVMYRGKRYCRECRRIRAERTKKRLKT